MEIKELAGHADLMMMRYMHLSPSAKSSAAKVRLRRIVVISASPDQESCFLTTGGYS